MFWGRNVQQNGKILHQNKAKIKKQNMPRRIFFQEWFPFRVTEFPVERAFTIGWWCYITPVSSISCPNIELCQLFHWPKNVNKPNLVFLHILECTIRNTCLTNINLGRLSDIASHCKKYIYILLKSRFYHNLVYLILYFTFILQRREWKILRDL